MLERGPCSRIASTALALAIAACAPFQGAPAASDTSDASANGDANANDASASANGANDANANADAGPLPAYAMAVLADSPMVYYRLEESAGATAAHSSVGTSLDAAIHGAPMLGAVGKVGLAFDFGVPLSAYLELGADGFDFTGAQPFSLEAWVNATTIDGTYRHVFIKDTKDQSNTGRQEWGVWVRNGNVAFERIVDGQGVQAQGALTTNAWHHVVGVYDSSKVRLYIDGTEAMSNADGHAAKAKDKPVIMGTRDAGNASNMFSGVLDELAIYDHALTPAQISVHYNAAQ